MRIRKEQSLLSKKLRKGQSLCCGWLPLKFTRQYGVRLLVLAGEEEPYDVFHENIDNETNKTNFKCW